VSVFPGSFGQGWVENELAVVGGANRLVWFSRTVDVRAAEARLKVAMARDVVRNMIPIFITVFVD